MMSYASVKWVVNLLMLLIHSQTVLPIVSVQTIHSMQVHSVCFERVLNY